MLNIFLYFTSGIILFCSGIFLFFKTSTLAIRFLAGHLIILGFGTVTRTLIATGMIIDYPHIYGVVLPFQFLYGPFYFLFVFYLLNKTAKFRVIHWLHFLPFFINLVDLIPFYLSNFEIKRDLIINKNNISFLGIPGAFYNSLKSFSVVVYVLLAGRLYVGFFFNTSIVYRKMAKRVNAWLAIDFGLKLITVVSGIYIVFIHQQQAFTWGFYLFTFDAFFNIVYLLLRPELIHGLPIDYGRYSAFYKRLNWADFVDWVYVRFKRKWDKDQFILYLEGEFDRQLPFLDHLFDNLELCRKLHISQSDLDEFINDHYNCSAADFINFKRIEYALDKINKDSSFKDAPVYKIALWVGFDSLVAFQAAYAKFASKDRRTLFNYNEAAVNKLDDLFITFLS